MQCDFSAPQKDRTNFWHLRLTSLFGPEATSGHTMVQEVSVASTHQPTLTVVPLGLNQDNRWNNSSLGASFVAPPGLQASL